MAILIYWILWRLGDGGGRSRVRSEERVRGGFVEAGYLIRTMHLVAGSPTVFASVL